MAALNLKHRFKDISLVTKNAPLTGHLDVYEEGQLILIGRKREQYLNVNVLDIKKISWMAMPGETFQLGLRMTDGLKHKLNGFRPNPKALMASYLEKKTKKVGEVENLAIGGGTNMGKLNMEGDNLSMHIAGNTAVELSIKDMAGVRTRDKLVCMDYSLDDTLEKEDKIDELADIKFGMRSVSEAKNLYENLRAVGVPDSPGIAFKKMEMEKEKEK